MKSRMFKFMSLPIIMFLLLSSSEFCFAMRAVPDDLIVHPVLITLNNEWKTTGSGFYFRDENRSVYLISACHVFIERDKTKKYVLRSDKANILSYPKDLDWSKPAIFELDLKSLSEKGLLKYDVNTDVIAIKITRTTHDQKKMKINECVKALSKSSILTVPKSNTKSYKEVLIGNDVYISGFPSSLGIKKTDQIDYNRPLLRKGIVAGKYDKRKTITIDCPTYGGNSGGPVIELESVSITRYNVRVIGIIIQFVPFVERWINPRHKLVNIEFENSGYTIVVPVDKIFEIIEQF